jgi:transposase
MSWTEITRRQYRRDGLRYASDLTDEEWQPIAPHLPGAKPLGRRRATDLREAVNAMLSLPTTGCQWRLLPTEFPPYTGTVNLTVPSCGTRHLGRAVAYVRGQGVAITDDALSHVAPVKWDHVGLTGDYLWSDVEIPRQRFRPLRTSRFNPQAFQAA